MKRNTTSLLLLALAACGTEIPGEQENNPGEPRAVTVDTPGVAEVASGNQDFAVDMYGELAGDENLFFSPFSISAALGMTWTGASGETGEQLGSALQAQLAESEWAPAFGGLMDDLNGDFGRGYTLHVANRVFGQQDFGWDESFLDRLDSDWRAPLEVLDFASDPDGSREHVNGWVEDETQDRIEDLLPPGSVTGDTRMVLANAIYFKADWLTQFDPEMTSEQPFTLANGSTVQTDMMNMSLGDLQDAEIGISWVEGATIGRLPYVGDEVAMYIVLPETSDGLAALEAGLSSEQIDEWVAAVDGVVSYDGFVALPKLEISWKQDLKAPLQALGVEDAFDPALAELDPMTGGPNGLLIQGVYHQAWMMMDEVGTEAAAATGVVVGPTSAGASLIAQHPFLFFIRDDLSGSILFMGRVADPTAG